MSKNERIITTQTIRAFARQLEKEEKSTSTIEKYQRDIHNLKKFAANRPVDKELVIQYKNRLQKDYAITSANSMLAAANSFFKFIGWYDCCVKQFKIHRRAYCPEEKELSKAEYVRLITTATENGDHRMSMLLQTIAGTGIRVSELEFITVEAVRKGEATVNCKGRTRTVFIVAKLRKKLERYIKSKALKTGPVFVSRSGRPLNRCNIWRQMKSLCMEANVPATKVFPHNLRHLFARAFYSIEKDIAKLADLLGHASIDTTRIYIVTTGREHRKRMEAMNLIL